jgi:hypothetical protein
MSFVSLGVAPLLVAVGGALTIAAPATAEPEDGGASAQSVIDDLKSEGYDVQINWLTGFDTEPLSVCIVSNVNIPGSTPPGSGNLATAYVDVSCPNHQDD